MTWANIYIKLLKFCTEINVKVRHVMLGDDCHGDYDFENSIIRINKNTKSYSIMCKTLAHEIGHAIDYIYGRFPKFFTDLGKYSNAKMRLVIEAEQSASQHATDILKYFGKDVEFEEFDYYLISLVFVPIWRQIYFD